MKNIIPILVLLMCNNLMSQEEGENNLIGKWELNWGESGFFPKEDLLFQKTSKELTDYVFELKKDGTVIHQNNTSMECPVGAFTLKYGNWKYKNQFLTLELRGEKIADYWYWWIIKYKVEKQGNKIWLKVDQIIKNRKLPATATWEELIDTKKQ